MRKMAELDLTIDSSPKANGGLTHPGAQILMAEMDQPTGNVRVRGAWKPRKECLWAAEIATGL